MSGKAGDVLIHVVKVLIDHAPDAISALDTLIGWAQGEKAKRVEEIRPAEGHLAQAIREAKDGHGKDDERED